MRVTLPAYSSCSQIQHQEGLRREPCRAWVASEVSSSGRLLSSVEVPNLTGPGRSSVEKLAVQASIGAFVGLLTLWLYEVLFR